MMLAHSELANALLGSESPKWFVDKFTACFHKINSKTLYFSSVIDHDGRRSLHLQSAGVDFDDSGDYRLHR